MDSRSIDIYRKALKEGEYRAHHIRVMVVGHYGVGKTTLTKRLFGDEVDIGKRESTDGIDVHVKRCKVSMNDGTWQVHGKQTDKDKARKAIFHQLAKLFKKDDQEVTQLQPSKEMNSMLDIEDTLHESAKPQEETRSQTCSCMDVDKAQEQKTTVEYPEDRRKTETKHSDTVMKESAEIIYSRPQSTDDIEEPAVESVDEDYAQSLRHLKKFIENVQVDKEHLGTSDLSLWDFAGQNVFYATHQVFFSRRAVYLLVTNISKHIDDTVDDDPWHTDCRGEAKCRIAEYIDFWLNSIHEFCSNEEDDGPPIILVGTFADQLKMDISPDDAFSKLREFLVDKVASCHLTTEDFLIDNTTEDGTIQSLKKHIFDEASKQGYWGEDIPAKWVTLEDNLIRLKEENLKVLDKDKLKELNKTLPAPIESDKELELFLQFHHEMGNIIYFRELKGGLGEMKLQSMVLFALCCRTNNNNKKL
ncbi:uncharacterized protein LOC123527054 [Mercenaria mercenaria]|uniref:uncharacterized protein LOC123527054 n=1 Tax=Mercenaria mercenaria TaxID=6596 RepID=UPI00234EB38B|nr:uncharacterized protein LOC123527054 [Mercenaria mercenaria]